MPVLGLASIISIIRSSVLLHFSLSYYAARFGPGLIKWSLKASAKDLVKEQETHRVHC